MHEHGWLIGYGMATALYDVPALERIHATLVAALWARIPATGAGRVGDHFDRAPTPRRLAPRLGEDPLEQEGSPVQVPVTVQPRSGRPTTCVVRT
jgi:hypothetical protein